MNRTHRASYTAVNPQIVHTLNDSNLRQCRPLRRSVSNLLRYSCHSVPQSTPSTPKTMSRACYSLRGPTIWREGSTVFKSVRRMRQAFTGPHLSRPRPCGKRASRALVPSLTLLQRFLVGDGDFWYFEDGRYFEDGELPHHILHFADHDALGGAPNRSAKLDVLWAVSGKTASAAHVVGEEKKWRRGGEGDM